MQVPQAPQPQRAQKPAFIFRIDEIQQSRDEIEKIDKDGNWIPLLIPGSIRRRNRGYGASGQYWYFNGYSLVRLQTAELPKGAGAFSTFSMFYSQPYGFRVLRGDATAPDDDETWLPLMFEHDIGRGSSGVCNVGHGHAMLCHRPQTVWLNMLLPSPYFGPPTQDPMRGGLRGELPVFLALIAFSMKPREISQVLPQMVQNGIWAVHGRQNGWTHKRGVVVDVYSYNGNNDDLERYEEGQFGNYYN